MLKGINPIISPELLLVLAQMGHGDTFIIADAHFPAHSTNSVTLRADGCTIPQLLNAILPLFPIDTYSATPIIMMSPVKGDHSNNYVEQNYHQIIANYEPDPIVIDFCDRFDFYEKARKASTIVVSGDTTKYGNILLTKGIVTD